MCIIEVYGRIIHAGVAPMLQQPLHFWSASHIFPMQNGLIKKQAYTHIHQKCPTAALFEMFFVFLDHPVSLPYIDQNTYRSRTGIKMLQDPDSEAPTDTGILSFEQNKGWYVTVMQVPGSAIECFYILYV